MKKQFKREGIFLSRGFNTVREFLVLRNIAYASSVMLLVLIVSTIIPIYHKPATAEATVGTATESTLTFTSIRSTASVTLTVDSADGTFATSAANQTAAFSIATNNYTGYTLTLKSGGNVAALDNSGATISAISAATDYDTFTANTAAGKALNNKWGIIPNYYNATGDSPVTNTTNYYPAPTNESAITLRETSTANSSNGVDNADNYTIGLGFRADYTNPSGTYTNSTFIIQYVANPVGYNITYSADGIDGVSNLPGVQSASASHTETPSTSGSTTTVTTGTASVNLSTVVPTRTGYTFSGWCLGTLSNNGTTCTGTTYASGASFGIDKTANNASITLKAKWTVNTYSLVITFAGTGVSSVKVCTVSGNCSGTNLKGTVSTSGGNVSGLAYGTAYYLYPAFTDGYEFVSWKKTDSTTGATLGSTSTENTTYTMGVGNGAVTVTGQKKPMTFDQAFAAAGKTKYNSYYKMQDATAAICEAVSTEQTTTLIDVRDNSLYRVGKLKDERCWMLDNLALDLTNTDVKNAMYSSTNSNYDTKTNASNTTLGYLFNGGGSSPYTNYAVAAATSSNYYDRPAIAKSGACNNAYCVNSPSSGNWSYDAVTSATINNVNSYSQGKIGVYYNYCAASAGSYCYASGNGADKDPNSAIDANEDICPSGWRMPTGGAVSTSGTTAGGGEYQNLYSKYNNAQAFQTALSTPLSGNFVSGKARYQGYYGYFWSSTWYDGSYMYYLHVYSTNVGPQSYDLRRNGYSVRCLVGS